MTENLIAFNPPGETPGRIEADDLRALAGYTASAPPDGPRCAYVQAASCHTSCDGEVDQEIVYTGSRGRILDRDPVCRGHASEAIERAISAGSIATITLEPLDSQA